MLCKGVLRILEKICVTIQNRLTLLFSVTDKRHSRGDRAEKIRTYNYPQNRVTDHRIGFTTKQLDRVMEGELDEIIEALIMEDQRRQLESE